MSLPHSLTETHTDRYDTDPATREREREKRRRRRNQTGRRTGGMPARSHAERKGETKRDTRKTTPNTQSACALFCFALMALVLMLSSCFLLRLISFPLRVCFVATSLCLLFLCPLGHHLPCCYSLSLSLSLPPPPLCPLS
jgi:hypothetical protein